MIGTRTALVVVCALAIGIYLNSLENGFALDDVAMVAENEQVHGIARLPEAVSGPYWMTGPSEFGMYRPVTLATFAVDWELWSGDPIGFHLTNIVLHAAATALVFLLLLQLGVIVPGALAGAAVFALHPVHVEAVANVVGRAEVLTTIFFLAACLVHGRWGKGWGGAVAVGALYLLSLLSKEMGVTLPGALLLLYWIRGGTIAAAARTALDRWRTFLSLGVALAGYLVLRAINTGGLLGGQAPWFWEVPPGTRFWTAMRVLPEYLRLMLVPVELVPDYGPGVIIPETSPWSGLVLAGALLAVALAFLVWRMRGEARLVGGGILWFAITVLPVSNLLFPVGILLAERTLYLPSVGLSLAIAGAASWVAGYTPTRVRPAAAVLLLALVAAGIRTWKQNPVWRETGTVLTYLVREHPANYRAQWALAGHYRSQGDTARALGHFAMTSRMVPGYFSVRVEHGDLLRAAGRWDQAAVEYAAARSLLPSWELGHLFLVLSLINAGRLDEAIEAGRAAVERFPESWRAHYDYGRALARAGRHDEAIQPLARGLELTARENRWAHWEHLAGVHLLAGDTTLAAVALDSARATSPEGHAPPSLSGLRETLDREGAAGVPFW